MDWKTESKARRVVDLSELGGSKHRSVMCYPRFEDEVFSSRMDELRLLGVTALEFSGNSSVFGTPVLGKGCVGIVATAYRDDEKLAIKIRRVDSHRKHMQREAEMLRKANAVGVGPLIAGASENLLLMEFVEGSLLPEWLERKTTRLETFYALRKLLEQCWRLDEIGLDHGELSYAPKHVILSLMNEPCIVDFETASTERRPSNVTSICNYLYMAGNVGAEIAKIFSINEKMTVVRALREYKMRRTRKSFEDVLEVCHLHTM